MHRKHPISIIFLALFLVSINISSGNASLHTVETEYFDINGEIGTYYFPEEVLERNGNQPQSIIDHPDFHLTYHSPIRLSFKSPATGFLYLECELDGSSIDPRIYFYNDNGQWEQFSFQAIQKGQTIELNIVPTYESHWDTSKGVYNLYIREQSGVLKYEMTGVVAQVSADFMISPESPEQGEMITFQSIADLDGETGVTYQWKYDNAIVKSGIDAGFYLLFGATPGPHTIELQVTKGSETDIQVKQFTVTGTTAQVIPLIHLSPEDPDPDTEIFIMDVSTVTGASSISRKWILDGVESNEKSSDFNPGKLSEGEHTVILMLNIDGLDYQDSKTFEVIDLSGISEIETSLIIDRDIVRTGDTIRVSGKVTKDGESVPYASVIISIQNDMHEFNDITGTTDETGQYTFNYQIPPEIITKDDPQVWVFKAKSPTSDEMIVSDPTIETISVLPVSLQISDLRLVQVIDPTIRASRSTPDEAYLASDVPMGARISVSFPRLGEYSMLTPPTITVSLEASGAITFTKQLELEVTKDIVDFDFFFTPKIGDMTFSVSIDPENKYHDPMSKLNERYIQTKIALGKAMEPLKIRYVPIDLDVSRSKNLNWKEFYEFVQKQVLFIKDVFPLPNYLFRSTISPEPHNYRYDNEDENAIKDLPIPVNYYELMGRMAVASFFENSIIVGVLPDDSSWWGSSVGGRLDGVSKSILFDETFLLKYGAPAPVSAHETSHLLGLHTWIEEYNWPDFLAPAGTAYPLMYYSGGVPLVDDRILIFKDNKIFDITNEKQVKEAFGSNVLPAHIYCYMGDNTQTSWVCKYTYGKLFRALMDPPHEPTLLVTGVIHSDNSVSFRRFYQREGLPGTLNQGNYTLQLVSASNEVLYETLFGSFFDFDAPFGVIVPYPAGTASVKVLYEGETLAEKTKSLNAPSISNLNLDTSDNLTISWTGSDIDGDVLYYSILFSNNKGEDWRPLAIETQLTTYTIDPATLGGGDECYIQVIAADGFDTYTKVSNMFSLLKQPPTVEISHPENGTIISERSYFEAYAISDAGVILDQQISWYSDVNGYLGNGARLNFDSLAPGAHIITMQTTDYDQIVTQTINIMISGEIQGSSVNHYLTGSIGNYTHQSKFRPRSKVISYVDISKLTSNDILSWELSGPVGQSDQYSYTVGGEISDLVYAEVDLSDYSNTEGEWTITVKVNNQLMSVESFIVEPSQNSLGSWLMRIGIGIVVLFAILIGLGYLSERKII
jgi:hypothetical protein